jgi:hypothetical protein
MPTRFYIISCSVTYILNSALELAGKQFDVTITSELNIDKMKIFSVSHLWNIARWHIYIYIYIYTYIYIVKDHIQN